MFFLFSLDCFHARLYNQITMKTLFLALLAGYIVFRSIMIYLSYKGKKTAEKEALALKYFTPEEIRKGEEYARESFGLSVLQRAVDFVFPFVFFFSAAKPLSLSIHEFLNGMGRPRETLHVMLFLAVYFICSFLVSLPFRFQFEFIREHKFGFSNMTRKEWFLYTLKQFAVGTVITTIIICAAYYIFRRPAQFLWLIPVVLLAFEFIITFFYPYLILPLFYKKSAFEDEKYAKVMREVAEKAGVKVSKIFQINESKYSKHTNAFFTGFGPEKSIYIFDTLIKTNTPEQVASVVAHEIGHWKNNHVLKNILLSFAGSVLMTWIVYFTYSACGYAPGYPHFSFFDGTALTISDIASLPLISAILTVFSFWLSPIENFVSRKFEVTADTYEIGMGGHPEIYIQSMVQLAKDNRSFLFPHPLVTFWYASHPPILERVKLGENFNKEKK